MLPENCPCEAWLSTIDTWELNILLSNWKYNILRIDQGCERARLRLRRSLDKATVDASPCLEGVCSGVGILWGRPTGLSAKQCVAVG